MTKICDPEEATTASRNKVARATTWSGREMDERLFEEASIGMKDSLIWYHVTYDVIFLYFSHFLTVCKLRLLRLLYRCCLQSKYGNAKYSNMTQKLYNVQ